MIINEILESVNEPLRGRTVEEVILGLGYTAVKLSDGSCGLAATLRAEIADCCSLVERAGQLSGGKALSLGELALSTDVLESAVGLATINAVLNRGVRSNVAPPVEALEIGKDNIVGIIGYIEPLIEPVRQRCNKLYIFERRPPAKEFVYQDWAANVLLPQCDIAIISGTTLINKTMDHLLELCRGKVAIIGPSTPLSPVLKKHGVSFAFGSIVKEPGKVLKIVAQGGGTRNFGESVEKINLRL